MLDHASFYTFTFESDQNLLSRSASLRYAILSVCMHVHEIELKSGDLNSRTIISYIHVQYGNIGHTHTLSLTTSSIESKKAR